MVRDLSGNTGSENSKGDSNSGGDASSGSGKYRCPFYQAGRATELKSALNRLERKLKRIKGKADAGSATQAEIEEFNRLLPTLKERNQAYNRYLKRECVEE